MRNFSAPFQMRHEPHYLVPQALTSAYPAPNLHNNPPFFFNPGFRFPPAGYSMNFAQIPGIIFIFYRLLCYFSLNIF